MTKLESVITKLVAILIVSSIICSQNVVQSGSPIKIKLYSKTVYGCGFMGMPCDQYYTSISMGNTVPQSIKVTFDTCFNDFFVPLKGYGNRPLHYDSGFDPKRSNYYRDGQVQYAYSTVSGRWYSDYMSLAGNNWFAMTFLVARDSSNDLSYEPWDGVVGLGPRMATQAGTSNLIMSLYQQNITSLLKFGLWFGGNQAAEITLGGIDSARAGNLQVFRRQNYANSDFWWVPLQPVTVNDQIIGCARGKMCTAILHSGISDIYGPRQQVNELYYRFGINFDRDRNTYVDCRALSSRLDIGFTFEDHTRYLTAQQYIKRFVDVNNVVRCYIPIYPTDTDNVWVFGTTFLANYYTAIDVAQNIILMTR